MNKPIDKDYLTRQFTNFNKSIYKEGDIITIESVQNPKLPPVGEEYEWVKLKDKKIYYVNEGGTI